MFTDGMLLISEKASDSGNTFVLVVPPIYGQLVRQPGLASSASLIIVPTVKLETSLNPLQQRSISPGVRQW